jgi:hypothetical protein
VVLCRLYSVFLLIIAEVNDSSCPLVLGKQRDVASWSDEVRLVHHLCVIISSESAAMVLVLSAKWRDTSCTELGKNERSKKQTLAGSSLCPYVYI